MRCGDIWWIVFAYKCIEIILHFYLCFSLLSSYQDPCMILFKIYIRKMFVAWLQDCFIDARHYAVTCCGIVRALPSAQQPAVP